ncbi:MAG: hypothetical protein KatS3mg059_1776 [Thermomicrobiales bacterium]|nr:MAG: hypothetical protein KatS3mg059_1776 [Thermomicrobiales bacterium]
MFRGHRLYRLHLIDEGRCYNGSDWAVYETEMTPGIVSTREVVNDGECEIITVQNQRGKIVLRVVEDAIDTVWEALPWLTVLMHGYEVRKGNVTVLATGQTADLVVAKVGAIVIDTYLGTTEAVHFTVDGVRRMPVHALDAYRALYDENDE